MFDIQAKRIHEYKRQLLMALGIVHQYLALVDDGVEPPMPRTYLLAGKAAPGYWAAKMIIKLINSLGEVINNDPNTRELIKVRLPAGLQGLARGKNHPGRRRLRNKSQLPAAKRRVPAT